MKLFAIVFSAAALVALSWNYPVWLIPTVKALQAGRWSVAINNTPTVNLSSDSTVLSSPTIPKVPFSYYQQGQSLSDFGHIVVNNDVQHNIYAISSITMSFADSDHECWTYLYFDDCAGNRFYPSVFGALVPADQTISIPFPTPLVIQRAGSWCLNVWFNQTGALFSVAIVGYAIQK